MNDSIIRIILRTLMSYAFYFLENFSHTSKFTVNDLDIYNINGYGNYKQRIFF